MADEPKQPFTKKLKEAAEALGITCASELPEPPKTKTAKAIWAGTLTTNHQDMAAKLYDGLKALADGGYDYKKNKQRQKDQAAVQALGVKDDFLKLAAEQYTASPRECAKICSVEEAIPYNIQNFWRKPTSSPTAINSPKPFPFLKRR